MLLTIITNRRTYLWHSETLGFELGTSYCSCLIWAHLPVLCAGTGHRCSPQNDLEQKSAKLWCLWTLVRTKPLARCYGWPCGTGCWTLNRCTLAFRAMCDIQCFDHFACNRQTWTTIVLNIKQRKNRWALVTFNVSKCSGLFFRFQNKNVTDEPVTWFSDTVHIIRKKQAKNSKKDFVI